jgi:hypothetical protein
MSPGGKASADNSGYFLLKIIVFLTYHDATPLFCSLRPNLTGSRSIVIESPPLLLLDPIFMWLFVDVVAPSLANRRHPWHCRPHGCGIEASIVPPILDLLMTGKLNSRPCDHLENLAYDGCLFYSFVPRRWHDLPGILSIRGRVTTCATVAPFTTLV